MGISSGLSALQCSQPSIKNSFCVQVKYNERFVEELHLPVERIAFGSAQPQPFAADTVAATSYPPVARPVLQQEAQAAATQDTFQVTCSQV